MRKEAEDTVDVKKYQHTNHGSMELIGIRCIYSFPLFFLFTKLQETTTGNNERNIYRLYCHASANTCTMQSRIRTNRVNRAKYTRKRTKTNMILFFLCDMVVRDEMRAHTYRLGIWLQIMFGNLYFLIIFLFVFA